MQDKYVKNCPFCDGTEIIESYQTGYATVTAVNNMWGELHYVILFAVVVEV